MPEPIVLHVLGLLWEDFLDELEQSDPLDLGARAALIALWLQSIDITLEAVEALRDRLSGLLVPLPGI